MSKRTKNLTEHLFEGYVDPIQKLRSCLNYLEYFHSNAYCSIEDCAKDGSQEFFTEMHCVQITTL